MLCSWSLTLLPEVLNHAMHQPIGSFLKIQKHKTSPEVSFCLFPCFYSLCRCAELEVFSKFWMQWKKRSFSAQKHLGRVSWDDNEHTNNVLLWTVLQILYYIYLYRHVCASLYWGGQSYWSQEFCELRSTFNGNNNFCIILILLKCEVTRNVNYMIEISRSKL